MSFARKRGFALPIGVGILTATAIYLYVFPAPTLAYIAIVLLHALLGIVVTIALVFRLPRLIREWRPNLPWLVITAGAAVGIALLFTGTSRPQWPLMYTHVAISAAAVALLAARWAGRRGRRKAGLVGPTLRYAAGFALAALFVVGGWSYRQSRWANAAVIVNPTSPPLTMDGEGDGPNGLFFPSSAQTKHAGRIPSQYFLESDACQRCHADIYRQWFGSMHHFSSFNNQWYRKSVEYMQDVVGVKPSKWCAGCHDPALLYSGMFDTPIKQIVDTPEARAGLGCMMCHSIVRVKSTMGQGDFFLEYPRLHEMAASKNPIVRSLHDFLIRLNPEPHRRVFLKPFMRAQTAEFCSTCHKVHLDVPVNHYRWIRGFNEYDNWQASGISGQGARSFYYPPKSQQCADCHMPLVPSHDAGAAGGSVHAHSFPGANTALPAANRDPQQLKLTEDFLKTTLTVDIFALSPALERKAAQPTSGPELATTFAVGEEAESTTASSESGPAAEITAPLNRVPATVRRGDEVRVDVVVRTRKVGHFFPAGTVDAYDVWLELKGTDNRGRDIFWSGKVEDDGHGPVERGAHFYRSLLIDSHGNPINKRNAWASRAVVYVRLIPPGAADTVHYRVRIPEDAGNSITLRARLCYRKFAWWNTQFSFAGVSQGGQHTPDYDDRKIAFNGDLSRVSGQIKSIPDLPIVSLAQDQVTVKVLPANSPRPQPQTVLRPDDWTRWNDYGIGLFLQGDLKGARAAFEQITRIDAKNADAWVNLGRVAVQEGDLQRARFVLEKALQLSPNLARANFFYGRALRNEGNYEESSRHLRIALEQYPRDRVLRNELGRVLFLQRKYQEAIAELQQVLAIDPEDLQAHYNLMLCYQGLGQVDAAQRERTLYLRFKADEAAQTLTGEYRQLHPEDNNERQPIHDHESAPLGGAVARPPAKRPHVSAPAGTQGGR
jgi:tetratricopeptide (TPR) repeat protein